MRENGEGLVGIGRVENVIAVRIEQIFEHQSDQWFVVHHEYGMALLCQAGAPLQRVSFCTLPGAPIHKYGK